MCVDLKSVLRSHEELLGHTFTSRGEDAELQLRASNEGSPRPCIARATEAGVLAAPLVSLESERIGGRWTFGMLAGRLSIWSRVFVAIHESQP